MELLDSIQENYVYVCTHPYSTSYFLPMLKEMSKECSCVVELGVENVVTTWAFLQGLLENNTEPKQLVSVDIVKHKNIDTVVSMARRQGIDMYFLHGSSLDVPLPERDMLFIDTWHIYGQLKRELEKHHASTRKYIVMHDTHIDAIDGESIRLNMDIPKQVAESGFSESEIREGLAKAIAEFVCDHSKEWKIEKVFYESFGLTILKRI